MGRNVMIADSRISAGEISSPLTVPIGASFTEQESTWNELNGGRGQNCSDRDEIVSMVNIVDTMPADSEMVITPIYMKGVNDDYFEGPSETILFGTVTDGLATARVSDVDYLRDADFVKITYRFKQDAAEYTVSSMLTQLKKKSSLGGGCGGVTDHGALTGLADDDHSQYPVSVGRSGGQILIGGTAAGESLTLRGTTPAPPGPILLNPLGGKLGTARIPTTNIDFHNPLDEDTEMLVSANGAGNNASLSLLAGDGNSNTLTTTGGGSEMSHGGQFSIKRGTATNYNSSSSGNKLYKQVIINAGKVDTGDAMVHGDVNDYLMFWDYDAERVCIGHNDADAKFHVLEAAGDFAAQFGNPNAAVTLSTDPLNPVAALYGLAGDDATGTWNDLLIRAGTAQLYFDADAGIGFTSTPRGLMDFNPASIGVGSYIYPYPEVTTIERGNLTGMVEGAHVYDTDVGGVYFYNGSAWTQAY